MSSAVSRKIKSRIFQEYFSNLIDEIKNKKVLIYGAGEAFEELEKQFNFVKNLNIVAISDLKFKKNGNFVGLKSIPPDNIKDYDYDVILMTLIRSFEAIKYLRTSNQINEGIYIRQAFEELLPQDNLILEYLEKINTEKHFKKSLID